MMTGGALFWEGTIEPLFDAWCWDLLWAPMPKMGLSGEPTHCRIAPQVDGPMGPPAPPKAMRFRKLGHTEFLSNEWMKWDHLKIAAARLVKRLVSW